MSIVRSTGVATRRLIGWILSGNERLSDLLLLAGPVILALGFAGIWTLYDNAMIPESRINLLWACWSAAFLAWCVLLAVLRGRGWLRICGPLLYYDLVRLARRRRYFLLRFLYVGLLSCLVFWVYFIMDSDAPIDTQDYRRQAEFASAFFLTFLGVQAAMVFVLTPSYTAGAIAMEKDCQTLGFLLATDLQDREIILGKWLSRVANLVLLLLAGLPILSFLQFMGGVDPNLLIAGFVATAVSLLSLSSLSMLNSVVARRSRDAISSTYVETIGYLLLSGASWLLIAAGLGSFPAPWIESSPVTLRDLVDFLNAGNPVTAVVVISMNLGDPQWIRNSLLVVMRDYLAFHGSFAGLFLIWSVIRLRPLARRQAEGEVRKKRKRLSSWFRPKVWEYSMLWKELITEPGRQMGLLAKILLVMLILGSYVPIIFVLLDQSSVRGGPFDPAGHIAEAMNIWVRAVGTVVACLLLLSVAARASSCISGERDRQTLDGLLTSPMGSDGMLFAKWLGNMATGRAAWLWLGSIYLLGLISLGLHPVACGLLTIAMFIYAWVVSGVGVWYSMTCKNTRRAATATVISVVGLAVGHWLIWACCIPLVSSNGGEALETIAKVQAGLTPPAVLSFMLPFSVEQSSSFFLSGSMEAETIPHAIAGLVIWSGLGAFLWLASSARFRVLTMRSPLPRAAARESDLGLEPDPAMAKGRILEGAEPSKPPSPMTEPNSSSGAETE